MEQVSILRFVLAFAFVLGLIGLFALVARKWQERMGVRAQATGPRLSVVEARGLGPKHKLLLVKRDETEHLLLLSPEGAQVVEAGIKRGLAHDKADQ